MPDAKGRSGTGGLAHRHTGGLDAEGGVGESVAGDGSTRYQQASASMGHECPEGHGGHTALGAASKRS